MFSIVFVILGLMRTKSELCGGGNMIMETAYQLACDGVFLGDGSDHQGSLLS